MNYINRRRSGSKLKKTIRDYIVPIIGGILVIILLVYLFKGGEDTPINPENQYGIEVTFDSEGSDAQLVYTGDRKKDMEGTTTLYKGEKVIVREGSVTIRDGTNLDFRVNKLGELKYLENGNYEVSSGEVWLNTEISVNVNMNFAYLRIDAKSHLSVSQNEMGSTIYLVSGFVEVSNLGGKTTVLAPGEKITVSRTDASKADLDMTLLRENIDQFFIKSDWYILNKGANYEGLGEGGIEDITGSGSVSSSGGTTSDTSNKNAYLTFNNLIDSSNVSSSSINISGVYNGDEVTKISVNGKEAVLNTTDKTFRIESVGTSNYENDLVFKVMDDSNDVLSKFVYTVYYNSGTNPGGTGGASGGYNVQTYDVDGSKFRFTAPTTSNTYTTSESFITIRGQVDQTGITKVTVNDYQLSSYLSSNGTWRYHASIDNNNLALGTNVYDIKYYSGDNLVYTNRFTIIRKEVVEAPIENTTDTQPTTGENSQGGQEQNLLF